MLILRYASLMEIEEKPFLFPCLEGVMLCTAVGSVVDMHSSVQSVYLSALEQK